MNYQFLTFQTYSNVELTIPDTELLKLHNIPFTVELSSLPFDPITLSGNSNKVYSLMLKKEDFERAELIFLEHAKANLEELSEDYYLFSFTDAELYDILLKPEEWNRRDILIAQAILKTRGKNIDHALIKALKNQRIADLAKPEDNQTAWIIAGYLFSLLGGFIGVILGIHLWSSKKTLPNGERVFTFSKNNRKHGFIIILFGLFMFGLHLIAQIAIY